MYQLGKFCLGTHAEMRHPYLNLPLMVIMDVLAGEQFWSKMELLPSFFARLRLVHDLERRARDRFEMVFAQIRARPKSMDPLSGDVRQTAEFAAQQFYDAAKAHAGLFNTEQAVKLCTSSLVLIDRLHICTLQLNKNQMKTLKVEMEIGMLEKWREEVGNFQNALLGKPIVHSMRSKL